MADLLEGRKLTCAAAALMALAVVAAVRLGVTGEFSPPGRETAAVPREGEARAGEFVLMAQDAEKRGDVAAALAFYRKAVTQRPLLVDRRSPDYLGEAFEARLKGWIAGLRRGELAAGPTALPDASYLFRRMYGGCG